MPFPSLSNQGSSANNPVAKWSSIPTKTHKVANLDVKGRGTLRY